MSDSNITLGQMKDAMLFMSSSSSGASSETILCKALGIPNKWDMPPSDAGDRGRCAKALLLMPWAMSALDRLADSNKLWAAQKPLILDAMKKVEGKS